MLRSDHLNSASTSAPGSPVSRIPEPALHTLTTQWQTLIDTATSEIAMLKEQVGCQDAHSEVAHERLLLKMTERLVWQTALKSVEQLRSE